jgi:hypothetical protein
MVTAITIVIGILWILAVWGQIPQDKNGRVDR